jgi:hypothetical protein
MCDSWQALHVGCCGAVLDLAAVWVGESKNDIEVEPPGMVDRRA